MKLEDLSLNKLWELFPITFTDNTGDFRDIYLDKEKILKSLLGNYITRISHIGSTSIKKIKTKPIIDILIEINFDNKDIIKDIANGNIVVESQDERRYATINGDLLSVIPISRVKAILKNDEKPTSTKPMDISEYEEI